MKIEAKDLEEYISKCPDDRKEPMQKLAKVIRENLDTKFTEVVGYGMPGWVVPHSVYPAGYHCNTKLPLPFINIASQKNFIAVYHMGVYADEDLMKWFLEEYPKHCSRKLDMGKSCIRFKKMDDIPYDLIGQLVAKMSAQEWIDLYEKNVKR